MSGRTPRVSIGVPVYNGARTLPVALESLLAQTFEDIEIIICDNASTDETEEISRQFASRDARILYHRAAENRGAAPNFNWAVSLARGEYFKWHAADDLIEPTFVEKCVARLDRDHGFVLCYTTRKCVDAAGEPAEGEPALIDYRQLPEDDLEDIDLPTLLRMSPSRMPLLVFGIMRTSVLRKTGLIGAFPASDVNLVYELRLHGRFAQVREPLYVQRLHAQGEAVKSRLTRKGEAAWFGARKGLVLGSRELTLLWGMIHALIRARKSRESGYGDSPLSLLREIAAFTAHLEIRGLMSLRRAQRSFFGAWSEFTEELLDPNEPKMIALRLWRSATRASKRDFATARAYLLGDEEEELLLECLGKLIERSSIEADEIVIGWLLGPDVARSELARAALDRASSDRRKQLLGKAMARRVTESGISALRDQPAAE